MRILVRYVVIVFGLAALVVATAGYRPELEQTAHARRVADKLKTNALVSSAFRENGEGPVETIHSSIQTGAITVPTVSPRSVNLHSQEPTSALLTFSNVIDLQPIQATFCDELVPVLSPDPIGANFGSKCKPGTTDFGVAPQRYNLSTLSANNTFTALMTFTRRAARLAYLKAENLNGNTLYYVWLFRHKTTRQEVGVPVTLHVTGNSAALPVSITGLRFWWDSSDKPIIFVKTGEQLPRVQAEINYTGTGYFVGFWKLVKPGDTLPDSRDLLPKASLPSELRESQESYAVMSRFNLYFPPGGGNVRLQGPESWRMVTSITGSYQVVLSIEATTDTQGTVPAPGSPGESALDAALRNVPSGGVAAFAFPTLKYYVSDGPLPAQPANITSANPLEFSPEDQATLETNQPVDFTWPLNNAATYRFEVENLQGAPLISAILPAGVSSYRAPSWFKDKVGKLVVHWRVISYDEEGNEIDKGEWRALRFATGTDKKNQQP